MSAQSFDRLLLRPRAQPGGTYLTAEVKFCASEDWPTADSKCVTLQAPPMLTPYDLFWPTAGATLTSCIEVNTSGQMGFAACGLGILQLDTGSAVTLDDSSGNESMSWSREEEGGGCSTDCASWVALIAAASDAVIWTRNIPLGFTTGPTFKFWAEPCSGSQDFSVKVRCAEPNNSIPWTAGVWDTANTGSLPVTTGGMCLTEIALVNDDGLDDEFLCQFLLEKTAGSGSTNILHATIE